MIPSVFFKSLMYLIKTFTIKINSVRNKDILLIVFNFKESIFIKLYSYNNNYCLHFTHIMAAGSSTAAPALAAFIEIKSPAEKSILKSV